MISSVIYYNTDAQKNVIYLLNCMLSATVPVYCIGLIFERGDYHQTFRVYYVRCVEACMKVIFAGSFKSPRDDDVDATESILDASSAKVGSPRTSNAVFINR